MPNNAYKNENLLRMISGRGVTPHKKVHELLKDKFELFSYIGMFSSTFNKYHAYLLNDNDDNSSLDIHTPGASVSIKTELEARRFDIE